MRPTYPVMLISTNLGEQCSLAESSRSVREYAISTARRRHRLHLATPLRDYPDSRSALVMKRRRRLSFADIPTAFYFGFLLAQSSEICSSSIPNSRSSSRVAYVNTQLSFRLATPVLSSFPLMLRALSCSEYSWYSNYW
jgi:hypothetical protein